MCDSLSFVLLSVICDCLSSVAVVCDECESEKRSLTLQCPSSGAGLSLVGGVEGMTTGEGGPVVSGAAGGSVWRGAGGFEGMVMGGAGGGHATFARGGGTAARYTGAGGEATRLISTGIVTLVLEINRGAFLGGCSSFSRSESSRSTGQLSLVSLGRQSSVGFTGK